MKGKADAKQGKELCVLCDLSAQCGNRVKGFLNEICGVMEENFEKFEIICVNDGCMDATVEKVREFLQERKQSLVVSLVNLSHFQGWKTP